MTTSIAPTLTAEQFDEIGQRLDAIRERVMSNLTEDDAAYIRRMIMIQRGLEISGRAALLVSLFPPAWIAGTAMLTIAKILENMELGHNIMHGQWDWMRDPTIHSTTWEWDIVIPAEDWKYVHNNLHHTWTNVVGKDPDVGYGILRINRDQPWEPHHLGQLLINAWLSLFFEVGIARYVTEPHIDADDPNSWSDKVGATLTHLKDMWRKAKPQVLKDYVAFPLLSGPSAFTTLLANATANIGRNMWTHAIIFCGHFPDGVQLFTEEQIENETRGQWYVRQLLGAANIEGSPLFHIMSGHLSCQIEHHIFPDMPSNHYQQVAVEVRALCAEYGLPYVTGSFSHQYGQVLRNLAKLSVPNDVVKRSVKAA